MVESFVGAIVVVEFWADATARMHKTSKKILIKVITAVFLLCSDCGHLSS